MLARPEGGGGHGPHMPPLDLPLATFVLSLSEIVLQLRVPGGPLCQSSKNERSFISFERMSAFVQLFKWHPSLHEARSVTDPASFPSFLDNYTFGVADNCERSPPSFS